VSIELTTQIIRANAGQELRVIMKTPLREKVLLILRLRLKKPLTPSPSPRGGARGAGFFLHDPVCILTNKGRGWPRPLSLIFQSTAFATDETN
jgi:hypothetical protein